MGVLMSASTSLVNELVQEILVINKLQKNFLEHSIASLSIEEIEQLNTYLQYCLNEEEVTLEYLSQCYDLIVKDTLTNQFYFKRHKRYKHSSYREVESLVYRNSEYMRMYMYGLAITAFLWGNHAQMKAFFKESLPKKQTGAYLEIGPGHGFYMMEAMQLSQYTSFLGVDISPTSVALTQSILSSRYFGQFSNFKIKECNFLDWDTDAKFDTVVMGEVLEHVEQPQSFLQKIAAITHEDSYIYITTCINSPAIDHIYLFENVQQIVDLVKASGLSIKKQLLVPYQDTTLEQSEQERLPINIAVVLGKKHG